MNASAYLYVESGTELRPSQREQIHEGLDVIAAHVGTITVRAVKRIKLPLSSGEVNPDKVGFKHLDHGIDLHIFAAPLSSPNQANGIQRLGASLTGTGVSFINTQVSLRGMRATTAHEVAHSLGYKVADLTDGPENASHHCSDSACIMHDLYVPGNTSGDATSKVIHKGVLLSKLRSLVTQSVEATPTNTDFCRVCTDQIRTTIDDHSGKLRLARCISGTVSRYSF